MRGIALTFWIHSALFAVGQTVFVATDGFDSNPGTYFQPLASIAAAQSVCANQGTIYIRGGTYFLSSPLYFSGTNSLCIRPYINESVRIVGGSRVTNWALVSGSITNRLLSAASTYKSDLASVGITNYGTLSQRGAPGWVPSHMPVRPAGMELFFNDNPMTMAQYPNGATNWALTTNVVGTYTATNFGFMDNRPSRWSADVADAWVYGFWLQTWADSHYQVFSIDTNSQRCDIVAPCDDYGWASNGGRFQWQNVFDELDSPGEYYLDRTNGVVYFYPPSDLLTGTAYVSTLTNLVVISNAANLTINGLTFEVCRGNAVQCDGATNILFGNCSFLNIGNYAAWITNAFRSGFTNCTITATGDGGFSIAGGDRTTLSGGSNIVLNCEFHGLGYFDRMDHAGVKLYGVGNQIGNCYFHDLPHNAIRLFGNNHVIEYCEFTNTVMQASDAGTVYGTKDWSGRGNVIRYCYFHHNYGLNSAGISGPVYLDDGTSGTFVYGNIFYDNYATGDVLVGGGRDNISTNNIFCNPKSDFYINREVIAMHMDGRFLPGQWANSSSNAWASALKSVPYTDATWTAAYQHINDMLLDDPCAPMYNQFTNNIITYPWWNSVYTEAIPYWNTNELYGTLNLFNHTNTAFAKSNPGFSGTESYGDFTNLTIANFVLTNGAPVLSAGFQQIPVQLIGRKIPLLTRVLSNLKAGRILGGPIP